MIFSSCPIIRAGRKRKKGEYERGDRIPPSDIIRSCERVLAVPAGYLQRIRQQALRERARAPGGWAGGSPPGPGA